MRIIGLFLVAIVLLWVILAVSAHVAANEAADAQWPDGLGTIRDVPRRYPAHPTTPAARHLIEMVAGIGVQLGAKDEEVLQTPNSDEFNTQVTDFVYAQLLKPDDAVDAPPAEVETFTYSREEWFTAIGRYINESAPAIGWREDIDAFPRPYPAVGAHLQLARLLAANALLKSRRGDASGWEEVHAIVLLARSLMRRGDMYCVSAGLSNIRLANGVARKLPPPVPAWWKEVDDIDARRALVAASQADTWSWWNWVSKGRSRSVITSMIFAPYLDASLVNLLRQRRGGAEELAAGHSCVFDVKEFNERWRLGSWNFFRRARTAESGTGVDYQRAAVFDYERSAVERVDAIKEHRPWPAHSRCEDGTWVYAGGELRFSANVPLDPPGKRAIPATLRY